MYQAVYAAYQRDWEFNTAAMADEYVFEARGTKRIPGLPDSVHGREGYLAMHRQLLESLDVDRVELDDVIPLEGRRVLALLRFVIRAGDGTFDQQFLDLHTFREDGALVRQTIWIDREEGLRELGL